jgi:hypothetical protein
MAFSGCRVGALWQLVSLYYYLIVLKAIFVDQPSLTTRHRPLTRPDLLAANHGVLRSLQQFSFSASCQTAWRHEFLPPCHEIFDKNKVLYT